MPGSVARAAALLIERVHAEAQRRGRARAGRIRPAGSRRPRGDRRPRPSPRPRAREHGGSWLVRARRGDRRRDRREALDLVHARVEPRRSASSTRTKRTRSPGLQLADLPELGADDRRRADEAAEARPVGAEDDRHVAGEVDGADRVGVVVDVRRMQAGFAAVGARPLAAWVRSGARRCGRSCNALPSRSRRSVVDVVGGEEVGRAVRAVEHADLPVVRVVRARRVGQRPSRRSACARRRRAARRPRAARGRAWPPKRPSVNVARLPR